MNVTQLLEEAVGPTPPPTAVDVDRARADGRRRVRHRRVLHSGGAVLAVCGLLLGTAAVADRVGGAGRAPLASPAGEPATGPPGEPTPEPVPPPATAPDRFDPTARYADFGWLPSGLAVRQVVAGHHSLQLQASGGPRVRALGGTVVATDSELEVRLLVVTRGYEISSEPGPDVARRAGTAGGRFEDAGPVNGRPARWNLTPGGRATSGTKPEPGESAGATGAAALRWEYAPRAWAEVRVTALAGQDARALARAFAQSVRFGVHQRIRLPFTAAGVPAALSPVLVQVELDPGLSSWRVTVEYADRERRTTWGDYPLRIIVLTRAAERGDDSAVGDPNTTLDGHPARRSTMAVTGGEGLQLFNVRGLYLELAAIGDDTVRRIPGGTVGLWRSMRLYPDPADWR